MPRLVKSAREANLIRYSMTVPTVVFADIEEQLCSRPLGCVFSVEERAELSRLGAVGAVCFRFFNEQGEFIKSPLMQRVLAIESASLKGVSRVAGIAGGRRKVRTLHVALRRGWINFLITDLRAAGSLLSGAQ